MGKIVKYCGACEESFAQKFGFCPNCGGALKAFEMNPVVEQEKVAATERTAETAKAFEAPKAAAPDNGNLTFPAKPQTETYEPAPKIQPAIAAAAPAFAANGNSSNSNSFDGVKTADVQPRMEQAIVSERPIAKAKDVEITKKEVELSKVSNPAVNNTTVTAKPLTAAVAAGANGNGNGRQYQATNRTQPTLNNQNIKANDGFHVTVIEEKNVGQRNLLLLGSMFLMLSLVMGGVVYSLFNKDLMIGAIDAGSPFYITPIDDVPAPIEEQPKPKIQKDAGGGGGGGREEETPTSKGRLATQMPDPPLITPTKTIRQMDSELKIQATTQGTKQIKATDEPYGDPNSKYTLSSDGMGSGRGQGSGQGTGQGSGRGTGAGTGIGSGFGGGVGDGIGNGKGSGIQGSAAPPPPPSKPPEPVGPTIGVNIISKPRPGYTDAARQNQVTGTVTLRVTFTANGQIGSISPVSGLPYGLTEQAIASARQIKFEPAKKNGVPQTVTKQVQYSFTIY